MIKNIIEVLRILFVLNKRKAQGISIQVIVAAAIALVVVVIIIALLTGKLGSFGSGVTSTLQSNPT
mgnify:CR=1 FL=1|tara:strand:+ start:9824 stop:10021 length:198 start_codon:yes stop_codon:yes gene_type:complete